MASEVRQLWKTTDEGCELVLYATSDGVVKRAYPGVRVLFWPNRKPCWAANMYSCALLKRGWAIGTVNDTAASLALLLRFLYEHRRDFQDMDDAALHRLSDELAGEPDLRSAQAKRRGGRQTNKILRRVLAFLEWYQTLFPGERPLVGEHGEGAQITVERRTMHIGTRTVSSLWHESMVPDDVPRDVRPMARNILQSLLDACPKLAQSRYVQKRASTLLKMLADTGARRVEINNLTVKDIKAAARRQDGLLEVRTAKRGDWKIRYVPLPRPTLNTVMDYIDIQRRLHVRRLIQKGVIAHDPGWLLLNDRGGKLHVETITQDIARLRIIAGVSERGTAHMLRHRWITIQVLERLKACLGQKLPLDVATTILTQVASMTGHKRIESLWPYIDLAFEEMGVWDTAEAVINMRMNAEAAYRELREIRKAHQEGSPLTKLELHRVDNLLHDLLGSVKPEFTE